MGYRAITGDLTMTGKLSGKIALVTGGSAGIGLGSVLNSGIPREAVS
jgi:hypothetical protein